MKINFSYSLRFGLRNKLLIGVGGLIVVIFAGVLWFIGNRIEVQTRNQIQASFERTKNIFDRIEEIQFNHLLESCILISEQPQFKANLDLARFGINEEVHQTVLFNANEFLELVNTDIIFITNSRGELIVRTDQTDKFGENFSQLPFIASALEGNDPDNASIYIEGNDVYRVVSVPVLSRNDILGTLTLGFKIKYKEVEQLKEDTKSEISFFLNHRLLVTTLDEESAVDLTKSTFVYNDKIQEAKATNLRTNSMEHIFKDERYLVVFSFLSEGQSSSDVMYAIAISLDSALEPLRDLQQFILFIGLVAVLITFAISFLVAKGVTDPVKKLVEGAHKIGSGDYNFSINPNTTDEIGTLAKAFNEMTAGLRERFHMEKFVSTSTLNMIKQIDKDGVKLGGERKNVTVFFSDIRGFTAFSEKVDPEEVISMLNMCLSKQAKLVVKYGGAIDKYVGDELVAVFEGENMVDNSVLCAIEIQKEMQNLNEQISHNIRIGIGINTGMVLMGNMGSEERLDYTVLGSNVNLGARLCNSAKAGQILLSESSYRLMKTKVKANSLEPISVKGISKPVQVYDVIYS